MSIIKCSYNTNYNLDIWLKTGSGLAKTFPSQYNNVCYKVYLVPIHIVFDNIHLYVRHRFKIDDTILN